jgi:hypothetical protein
LTPYVLLCMFNFQISNFAVAPGSQIPWVCFTKIRRFLIFDLISLAG